QPLAAGRRLMGRHVPHVRAADGWEGSVLPLTADQTHHLRRVLRRVDGEEVSYTDGAGRIGRGRLTGDGVERGEETTVPRPMGLTLAVAPPKSKDRARFVVEKLAELGVARLDRKSTRLNSSHVKISYAV